MKKAIEYLKEAGVSEKNVSPYVIKAMNEYARQVLLNALQWIEDNDIKNLTPEQTASFYFDENK